MRTHKHKRFLVGGILTVSVFFIEILFATGATLVPTAPTLRRVVPTTDGYALEGSGFGTDRNQVQVYEGATQVPATAVVSVANDRIAVRSRPSDRVLYKVRVGGRESGTARFTPVGVLEAAKAKAEEEARKKAGAEAKAKVVFQPKKITTGELIMTGLRFQSKKITTGELAMTGLRFQPKNITTGELTMTGLRFQPKNVTTGELTMTGLRFQPKAVTTGELTMTGLRFQPKSVTTGELTMTGLRE